MSYLNSQLIISFLFTAIPFPFLIFLIFSVFAFYCTIRPHLSALRLEFTYDKNSLYVCHAHFVTEVLHFYSGRNKSQKLVGHFFEDGTLCRLLIAFPLKMYNKFDQPKQILVDQMLKLVRKWPMASFYIQDCQYNAIYYDTNNKQRLTEHYFSLFNSMFS